jgi:uncharacterized membrane protein
VIVGRVPVLGLLVWILTLIVWVFLMAKALQGKRYLLPIVGKFAAGESNKTFHEDKTQEK